MKVGAAYIRVSTEEQTEFSPESQRKMIMEYAKSHEIHLPEEYVFRDDGISGRSAKKRPAFQRMIALAKSKPPPFELILVWKFSRFARSRQDSILYKSMLRRECGVEVVSVTEQLSSDPTAILVEALLEAMDEYYSINLSQEVRRGMNEKFIRGGVVSVPPFGYRMGQEGCFEPDGERAVFVKEAFLRCLNGDSLREIATAFNEAGIKTARGNAFEGRSIAYLLQNPTYLGFLRRTMEDGKQHLVRGNHKPLIEKELFERVQQRLGQRRTRERETSPQGNATYVLFGLVRCSDCGAVLVSTGRKGGLQCPAYAKGRCKHSHYVSLSSLEACVKEKLLEDLGETNIELQMQREEGLSLRRQLVQRERRKLERAAAAYEVGVDTLEEYAAKKKKILSAIQSLQEEVEVTFPEPFLVPLKRLLPVLFLREHAHIGNRVLRAIVSNIVFDRQESCIRIEYQKP